MLSWLLNKFRCKPKKKTIVLSPRWADIWAGSKNEQGVWGAGNSSYEALGNLIVHNPEKFNIEIIWAFGDKPQRPLGVSYVTVTEDQYNAMMYATGWSRK